MAEPTELEPISNPVLPTVEEGPPQVFISYTRTDQSFVEKLAGDLEKAGYDTWWDVSDLSGGDRWAKEIQDALRASKYCIVVLSPDSVQSEWVEKEYVYAAKLGVKIIPVLYRTCDIPLALTDLQYIDFQGGKYAAGLLGLVEVLTEKQAHPPAGDGAESKPRRKPVKERLLAAVRDPMWQMIGVAVSVVGVLWAVYAFYAQASTVVTRSTPATAPTDVQASAPSPTDTSTVAPTDVQTSAPSPTDTSTVAPTDVQTSAPSPTNTKTPFDVTTSELEGRPTRGAAPATVAVALSRTWTPTASPSPVPAATPHPTETTPPTPSALFETSFERGLPDGMEVVYGAAKFIDRALIAQGPTLLSIGSESWRNYQVEYETRKHTYCWGLRNNGIAAHAADPNYMLIWSWNYCESAWFEIDNGNWVQVDGSAQGNVANPGATITVKLVAEDGNFTLYINNNERTSYFDKKYLQGRVYILLSKSSVVDNIRVRPLP